MQSHLARESLCFAEFGEAITRLHEEKMGSTMSSTSDFRNGRPIMSARGAGRRGDLE